MLVRYSCSPDFSYFFAWGAERNRERLCSVCGSNGKNCPIQFHKQGGKGKWIKEWRPYCWDLFFKYYFFNFFWNSEIICIYCQNLFIGQLLFELLSQHINLLNIACKSIGGVLTFSCIKWVLDFHFIPCSSRFALLLKSSEKMVKF